MPIKSIPKKTLEGFEDSLSDYLITVLVLKNPDALAQLTINIPYLLDLVRGMNFKDVKKMFDLYVAGDLGFDPMPNYIDRILIHKIVNSYRSHLRKVETPKIDEKEYKELQDLNDALGHWSYFENFGKLDEDNAVWLYSYFFYKKIETFVDYANNHKREAWHLVRDLDLTKEQKIDMSKVWLLIGYFKKLKAKGIELNNVLN